MSQETIDQRTVAELFDRKKIPANQLLTLERTRLFYVPPAIEQILTEVTNIEQEQFGVRAFSNSEMLQLLVDEQAVNVLLRDRSLDQVVGFVFSGTTEAAYEYNYPERRASADTAYIMDTAIASSHQGRRLTGKMMSVLEAALRDKRYTHMERDASTNHRYADNIRKNYAKRIEAESGPHPSPYGPQVFFRIRL
jgi:ribosomal protein S18 acetylase RimI-like enzyme